MKLIIYTDGACAGNPGKGGWAAIILDGEHQSSLSGSVRNTTNNRMELMAPFMALKKIKKKSEITIYTDSKYVKDGITEWIKKWKLNNWKSSSKKPVKNKDLWVKLDDCCQKHNLEYLLLSDSIFYSPELFYRLLYQVAQDINPDTR